MEVGDWHIDYRIKQDTRGRLVIAELHIQPRQPAPNRSLSGADLAAALTKPVPAGGIGARLLRRIRLGAEARWARSVLSTQDLSGRAPEVMLKKLRPVGRPQTLTIGFYRKVAKRRAELDGRRAKNPNKTLEHEFGYSQSGMAALVRRCRQKGLL